MPPMPSLPGKSPGDHQIPLPRAWSLPSPPPNPGSIRGKANGSSGASPFSPSSLWGGMPRRADSDSARGGRVAEVTWLQGYPQPPLCALLGFSGGGRPQEVGGVERDPGFGVTRSPGGDGGVCGEHILLTTWGRAPSLFAIRSAAQRCPSRPGTWPPLFVATDNNNKDRGNMCLSRET